MLISLIDRWNGLCRRLPQAPPLEAAFVIYPLLETLYAHPPRAYHNLSHIENCLALLAEPNLGASDPAIEFALWFHDCIYIPGASDNELKSAALATVIARGLLQTEAWCESVRRLIFATRHNGTATAVDEQILADIDLSILGASWSEYDCYRKGIRKEYDFVDDAAFREGRTAVLRSFLVQSHIFHTDRFRDRFESIARTNIEREIAGLQGQ